MTVSTFQSPQVAQLYRGRYLQRDAGEDDSSDERNIDQPPTWGSLQPARWSAEPEPQVQLEQFEQLNFGQEQDIDFDVALSPIPEPELEPEPEPSRQYEPIRIISLSSPSPPPCPPSPPISPPLNISGFVSYNPVKKPRILKPELEDYRKGLEKFTGSFKVEASTRGTHPQRIRTIAPNGPIPNPPRVVTPNLPRIRLKKVAGSMTATLVFRDEEGNEDFPDTSLITHVPTTSGLPQLSPDGENGSANSIGGTRIEVDEGETSGDYAEKIFHCPTPGCIKRYKQSSGLLYHLNYGQCRQTVNNRFKRRIHCPNPKCQRNYATRNGLQYHLERTACREVIKRSLKITVPKPVPVPISEDSASPSPSSSAHTVTVPISPPQVHPPQDTPPQEPSPPRDYSPLPQEPTPPQDHPPPPPRGPRVPRNPRPSREPPPPRDSNLFARAAKRKATERIMQGVEESDVESEDDDTIIEEDEYCDTDEVPERAAESAAHTPTPTPSLPPPLPRREPEIVDPTTDVTTDVTTDDALRSIFADVNVNSLNSLASSNEINSGLPTDSEDVDENTNTEYPSLASLFSDRGREVAPASTSIAANTHSHTHTHVVKDTGYDRYGLPTESEAIPKSPNNRRRCQMEGVIITQPKTLFAISRMDQGIRFQTPQTPVQNRTPNRSMAPQINHIADLPPPPPVVKVEQDVSLLLSLGEAGSLGVSTGDIPSEPIDLELMYPDYET